MLIRPPLNCPCDTSYGDVARFTETFASRGMSVALLLRPLSDVLF